jgi:uncharacterized Tic20 family protein
MLSHDRPNHAHRRKVETMAQPPPGGDASPSGPPGMPSEQERTWALAAHVGSFLAAYLALGFLCPLIVLLAKGNASRFVRYHAVIMATLAASRGQLYRYPVSLRLVK